MSSRWIPYARPRVRRRSIDAIARVIRAVAASAAVFTLLAGTAEPLAASGGHAHHGHAHHGRTPHGAAHRPAGAGGRVGPLDAHPATTDRAEGGGVRTLAVSRPASAANAPTDQERSNHCDTGCFCCPAHEPVAAVGRNEIGIARTPDGPAWRSSTPIDCRRLGAYLLPYSTGPPLLVSRHRM